MASHLQNRNADSKSKENFGLINHIFKTFIWQGLCCLGNNKRLIKIFFAKGYINGLLGSNLFGHLRPRLRPWDPVVKENNENSFFETENATPCWFACKNAFPVIWHKIWFCWLKTVSPNHYKHANWLVVA